MGAYCTDIQVYSSDPSNKYAIFSKKKEKPFLCKKKSSKIVLIATSIFLLYYSKLNKVASRNTINSARFIIIFFNKVRYYKRNY